MEADLVLLEQGRSVRRKRSRERRWAIARTVTLAAGALIVVGLGLDQLSRAFGTRGTPATEDRASIFVLPFRHSAPSPLRREAYETDQDVCLCGRVTDAFIDGLALIPGMRTGPRKSGWIRYDEDEIRRSLARTNDTRYLLTGRVDHTNEVLRLALRLYERQKDEPFWIETFAGTTNDLIALEQRAIEHIARRFTLPLVEEVQRRIDGTLSNNLAAHGLFQRARSLYPSGFKANWQQAHAAYTEALILDPKYAAALIGVITLSRELGSDQPPQTVQPVMHTRAMQLMALDDTCFAAHLRAANKRLYYDYDWEGGMKDYERMIATWPEDNLEWVIYFRTLGRTNKARVYHDRLKRQPHLNLYDAVFIVYGELVWRHHDEAIQAAHRVIELYPESMVGQYMLGRAHLAAGHYAQAVDSFKKASGPGPGAELLGLLGRAYALAGDRANALDLLRQLEQRVRSSDTDPYFLAWIQAALGQTDEALDSLQKAVEYRSEYIVHSDFGGLRTDQAWNDLREDPRFEAICRRVGMGKGQWPK
jgi:tetratricopeptide (TPR) repeat protein